jgi:hypothetical protein
MAGTLGDCLQSAEWYLSVAEADGAPAPGQADTVHQAQRLTAILGRYLDAIPAVGTHAVDGGPYDAITGMRAGLRTAGEHLRQAMPRHGGDVLWLDEAPADPVDRRYAQGVDALAAGGDLLGTHRASNAGGYPVARSDWAQVLAAGPVAAALATEVALWAHRAECMVDRAIDTPGHKRGVSALALAAARGSLAAVARTTIPADSDTFGREDLLHAIPSAAVPARAVPAGDETDAGLCAGIGVSARRLRAAAFAMEQEPAGSSVLSGPAWHRMATAAAITCDLAAQITGRLAAAPARLPGTGPDQLRDVAASFVTARDMWRHVGWMWQRSATDTISKTSPATGDATDLAVRLGRLAFGDPGWTPGAGHKPAVRPAGDLAPDAATLAAVVSAVHEAADAVTRMARADLAGVGGVCRAGRLYLQARVLGGDALTARHAYVRAPADRARILRNACYLCADTSLRAAAALDGPVLEAGAPSRVLALVRAVVPPGVITARPEPDFELSPGAFADQVDLFSRPRGVAQMSRVQVRSATVISACTGENVPAETVARRFGISVQSVTAIVADAGLEIRHRSPQAGDRQPWKAETAVPRSVPPQEPETVSPLLRELRRRGIDDPGVLDRAAIIDRAAAGMLLDADEHAARRRTAAQLAAMDVPAQAKQPGCVAPTADPARRQPGQASQSSQADGQRRARRS